jgi:hypothetical protein
MPCSVDEACVSEELITSVFSVEEEAMQGTGKKNVAAFCVVWHIVTDISEESAASIFMRPACTGGNLFQSCVVKVSNGATRCGT